MIVIIPFSLFTASSVISWSHQIYRFSFFWGGEIWSSRCRWFITLFKVKWIGSTVGIEEIFNFNETNPAN